MNSLKYLSYNLNKSILVAIDAYLSYNLNKSILVAIDASNQWNANSVDPNQMPHSVASDLGLLCLLRCVWILKGKCSQNLYTLSTKGLREQNILQQVHESCLRGFEDMAFWTFQNGLLNISKWLPMGAAILETLSWANSKIVYFQL